MQGSTVSQCVAASPSDCSKVGLSFDSGTKRCVLSNPPNPCDPSKQVAVGMQLNCPVGGECALAMKCHPIPWASKSWQCPAGSFSRGIDPSTYTPVCVSYPSISSAQNCYGEWQVDCENARLTYKVHVQASGGGAACPHADGFVKKATTGDCPSCLWLPQRPIQCEPKCGGVRLMQCADAVGSACAPSLCGPKPADVACSDPSCPPTDCHFCDSRPECGSDTGDCKPETLGALFCRCRIQTDGTRVCSTYRAGSRVNCP